MQGFDKSVSVFFPTYNEEGNIERSVNGAWATLASPGVIIKILVELTAYLMTRRGGGKARQDRVKEG